MPITHKPVEQITASFQNFLDAAVNGGELQIHTKKALISVLNKSLKPQKTLLGKIKVEALDVTDDQVIYDKIKETYFPGMSDKYETPEVLRLAYKEYIKEGSLQKKRSSPEYKAKTLMERIQQKLEKYDQEQDFVPTGTFDEKGRDEKLSEKFRAKWYQFLQKLLVLFAIHASVNGGKSVIDDKKGMSLAQLKKILSSHDGFVSLTDNISEKNNKELQTLISGIQKYNEEMMEGYLHHIQETLTLIIKQRDLLVIKETDLREAINEIERADSNELIKRLNGHHNKYKNNLNATSAQVVELNQTIEEFSKIKSIAQKHLEQSKYLDQLVVKYSQISHSFQEKQIQELSSVSEVRELMVNTNSVWEQLNSISGVVSGMRETYAFGMGLKTEHAKYLKEVLTSEHAKRQEFQNQLLPFSHGLHDYTLQLKSANSRIESADQTQNSLTRLPKIPENAQEIYLEVFGLRSANWVATIMDDAGIEKGFNKVAAIRRSIGGYSAESTNYLKNLLKTQQSFDEDSKIKRSPQIKSKREETSKKINEYGVIESILQACEYLERDLEERKQAIWKLNLRKLHESKDEFLSETATEICALERGEVIEFFLKFRQSLNQFIYDFEKLGKGNDLWRSEYIARITETVQGLKKYELLYPKLIDKMYDIKSENITIPRTIANELATALQETFEKSKEVEMEFFKQIIWKYVIYLVGLKLGQFVQLEVYYYNQKVYFMIGNRIQNIPLEQFMKLNIETIQLKDEYDNTYDIPQFIRDDYANPYSDQLTLVRQITEFEGRSDKLQLEKTDVALLKAITSCSETKKVSKDRYDNLLALDMFNLAKKALSLKELGRDIDAIVIELARQGVANKDIVAIILEVVDKDCTTLVLALLRSLLISTAKITELIAGYAGLRDSEKIKGLLGAGISFTEVARCLYDLKMELSNIVKLAKNNGVSLEHLVNSLVDVPVSLEQILRAFVVEEKSEQDNSKSTLKIENGVVGALIQKGIPSSEIRKQIGAISADKQFIAKALYDAGQSAENIFRTMKDAKFSISEIVRELQGLKITSEDIANIMINEKYSIHQVVQYLVSLPRDEDAQDYLGPDTARLLRAVGFDANKIAIHMREIGYKYYQIAKALHKQHYSREEVRNALRNAGGEQESIAGAMSYI